MELSRAYEQRFVLMKASCRKGFLEYLARLS
jgi:hypothetical protein